MGAAVLDQVSQGIHLALSTTVVWIVSLYSYGVPFLSWLTDDDPVSFYKAFKLNAVMYLLTTVFLTSTYRVIAHFIEKRTLKRLEKQRAEAQAPFRSVLVSKLVTTQSELWSVLTAQSWEGNWGRPKLRNFANAVGQVEVAFSDALLNYKSVLTDGEQTLFGVYVKLLAQLRTQIEQLRLNSTGFSSSDVAKIRYTTSEFDECLSNLASKMGSEFKDRIIAAQWNSQRRADLVEALWQPLEQRASSNQQKQATNASISTPQEAQVAA